MLAGFVVMGVAGAGKTTLARALAGRLGLDFLDADALHPPENVAKMQASEPLDDADRAPWLAAVAAWMDEQARPYVVACSALKRAYRAVLTEGRAGVRLVFLEGTPELVAERAATRAHPYFPASLVASQFAALEPPGADEAAIVIDAKDPTEAQVAQVISTLG